MDLSEEERERYEEELDDIPLKALVIEQNALIRDLHGLLLQAVSDESVASQEPVSEWECQRCQSVVREDERRDHMEIEHNAPPGMDLSGVFERV